MVRTRSRIYSTYILLLDEALLFHERFVSRRSLGENNADSIIASNNGISIDTDYDEMISELLDDFPILGWRPFLLNCLNDEIVDNNKPSVTKPICACREVINKIENEKKRKRKSFSDCLKINIEIYEAKRNCACSREVKVTYRNNIIAPKGFYYYGFPGEEYNRSLMSTTFPNTRGSFLTNTLRNVINSSSNFRGYPNNMFFDIKGKDEIMKLIEHCRIKNHWGTSSFFDNTMREIVFMNYLLTQRNIIVEYNIATHNISPQRHCNWFKPTSVSRYKAYARERISVLSIHQLINEVNLVSENTYPRDAVEE